MTTSEGEQGPNQPVEAGFDTAVERLDSENPTILAFYREDGRRDRLAREVPCDGALRGMVVGVKDLFRVDGLPTTAGSTLPAELFAGEESWVVSVLRAAGALVLGKTAMDEFAYCEPPPTRNPRDVTRTPGGSSGGSAAAVAAGMCPLAIGSQTLQSTILPAAYCGVVGYKPSFGRWPFDGVGLAPSFDTVGFLADDIALVDRVAAAVLPGWRQRTATKPVIGVPDSWGVRRLHTEGWTAFARHVDMLRYAGFEIRTSSVPWNEDMLGWSAVVGDLMRAEFAEVHRDWFDRYGELYRTRTAEAVERGRGVPAARVTECVARRDSLIDELRAVTEDRGIDCWICPAAGSVAPPHGDDGDSWMTCFWSLAGWPAVSVPIFDGDRGLPHGLQVIAPHGRDEQLLQWAVDIHAALGSEVG